ncbi:SPla/RYanodine receptor SPRY [Corchorus olitorius]|uniref:SPla/RYanodine receptor SPRY n=1 Tax=Corchorus olitorius TaxID=93759 RepID=A0A1R3I6S6_9ROSI|nr:SPla/RYanodine receptor SPRY [Corchorus olitorius]
MNSSNSSNNGESNNGKNSSLDIENRDLGLYFLELARLGSSKAPTDMEEDEEEAPKELNTINSSGGFLVVAPDKLSVKYTSVNLHGHDVGVVQANKPAPVKRLLYYFEIYVKDAGAKGQIAIGFTNENFKMRRQPGWEANSFGYHGDDGFLYRGHGKGDAFGPTYTTGDTVGGGINYASQEFFFTKNGAIVGTVSKEKEMKAPLFPTIAVHSQNEELVRSYLLHYGYEDTLSSFDLASKSTVPPIYIAQENGFDEQNIVYALNQRKTLRQALYFRLGIDSFVDVAVERRKSVALLVKLGLIAFFLPMKLIRNGEIDAAISKLRDWYPQIVQGCLNWGRLVRGIAKQVGALEEAVKYGRKELAKFFELAEFTDLVQDCVALLAYEHPLESCVGYLLEESQRDVVADTVNAMILSTNPNMKDVQGCLHSYLEKLLRQLTACCLERRLANGDQGEAFHLHQVLKSGKDIKS